jgi:hypothetical protein
MSAKEIKVKKNKKRGWIKLENPHRIVDGVLTLKKREAILFAVFHQCCVVFFRCIPHTFPSNITERVKSLCNNNEKERGKQKKKKKSRVLL